MCNYQIGSAAYSPPRLEISITPDDFHNPSSWATPTSLVLKRNIEPPEYYRLAYEYIREIAKQHP